jgi:hypothetical protein
MSDRGEVLIKIDLFGIGIINGKIMRHFAPLSADAVIDHLPIILKGRFSFEKKIYWTLPGIEIFKGTNPKSYVAAKKGDIAYNPKSEELIFFLEDCTFVNKINKIGEIIENIDFFLKARNGLNTKISRL